MEVKMYIYICDDEKIICDNLKNIISKQYKDIEIKTFQNVVDMKNALSENSEKPFLIFMDICLETDNGIDFAKSMKGTTSEIPIVFITGFTEYCQDIFLEYRPFGLLTKPISEEKLFYYINNAIKKNNYKNLSIDITHSKNIVKVKNCDIQYIESNKRKVIYFTKEKEYEEYIKLDEALEKLITGFLRCHKSFAVNLSYISAFDKENIITKAGKKIPVSRSYRDIVEKTYLDYISDRIGG